jgi:hypothetical protein
VDIGVIKVEWEGRLGAPSSKNQIQPAEAIRISSNESRDISSCKGAHTSTSRKVVKSISPKIEKTKE